MKPELSAAGRLHPIASPQSSGRSAKRTRHRLSIHRAQPGGCRTFFGRSGGDVSRQDRRKKPRRRSSIRIPSIPTRSHCSQPSPVPTRWRRVKLPGSFLPGRGAIPLEFLRNRPVLSHPALPADSRAEGTPSAGNAAETVRKSGVSREASLDVTTSNGNGSDSPTSRVMRRCVEQMPPLERKQGSIDHIAACWFTA